MALFFIPSEKSVATLDAVDQAMVRAQTLLEKTAPSDPDAHEKRFEFFTKSAAQAPFLALDKAETDKRVWVGQKICVKDALKTILPSTIMVAINHKLDDIQRIMSGSARVEGFKSFWYSHAAGNKHVAQFCVTRIPQWGVSRFETYFVEITAEFDSSAVFGMSKTSNSMSARYCFQQYSVSTDFLLREMQINPQQAVKEMDEWMRSAKAIA